MKKTLTSDPRLLWVIFICLIYLFFFPVSKQQKNGQCFDLICTNTGLHLADCEVGVLGKPSNIPADLTPFFFLKLPINSASKEALEAVNGIGPYLAKNIIDYRNHYGSISNVDELRKIRGIGEKRSRYLSKYVSF